MQGVAFSHLGPVVPDEYPGAPVLRHLGGPVCAVVRHHKGGQKLRRIVLGGNAVQQVGQYRLLIPRRNQNGVSVKTGRLVRPWLDEERDDQIYHLVQVADPGKRDQQLGNQLQPSHMIHKWFPLCRISTLSVTEFSRRVQLRRD